MMFFNNPNIEKLAPKVFIYRNFIEKEICDEISKIMEPWSKQDPVINPNDHYIDWYHGKLSPRVPLLYDVWCKINELLLPEYCIHPQLNMLVTRPGDEMFIHSDSPGESMNQDLTAEDRWNTCCVLHYGALVYFGEWEGGEVFYPNVRNDGEWVGDNIPLKEGNELKIKPNPGDLVIHGALDDYAHGVHTITSGVRYAFSNFVLPVEKNSGTFPIYGSKENEERWAAGMNEWLNPIGFTWEVPDPLKKKLDEQNVKALPPTSPYPSEILKERK
jgi:hypothetical protein